MFEQMRFERFSELAKGAQAVALYRELPGDQFTPSHAVQAIEPKYPGLSLLESAPKESALERFSHLCFGRLAQFTSVGERITIDEDGEQQQLTGDAFLHLRTFKAAYSCACEHELSGFVGGLVGYMAYDGVRLIENIPDRHAPNGQFADLNFSAYRYHLSFDHASGKVLLSCYVPITGDVQGDYDQGCVALAEIIELLHSPQSRRNDPLSEVASQSDDIHCDVSDADYRAQVEAAKRYIHEGDCFQVVLSRTFSLPTTAAPFDIYRALRYSNPSPYLFYLDLGNCVVAGASPEKLVSLENGRLQSRPLAGTRRRIAGEDAAISEELLSDSKEIAEHMMLVDLARNDVGKVAQARSVEVMRLKEIEYYTRVMHISSTVEGDLAESYDVFDALKASFPAGTLSGAPKIRAMEIIDELETSRRGLYGGTVCGIDQRGNLYSCIAIRMAVITDGRASVRAGAGVVADSDPQSEADETRHKARAILEGITLAQGAVA